MANNLYYSGIEFPVSKKSCGKIEVKNNIGVNVFDYESGLVYPIRISSKRFKDHLDLLLIKDDSNSHYVYIKGFNRFMYNEKKHGARKYFCRYFLHYFSSKELSMKHITICLKVSIKQGLEVKAGKINLTKYHR